MSVRKRGYGWQVDVRYRGKRLRETVYGAKEEALARESEIRASLYRGEPRAPKEPQSLQPRTLAGALESAKLRWQGTKAERTTLANARLVVDYFGEDTLTSAIKLEEVNAYISHLQEVRGNSTSTINRKISALRVILTAALDHGWIDKVPRLPQLRERKHRVVCYSHEEEREILRILQTRGHTRLAALIVFLVDTGLRLGEARKLNWRDIREDAVVVLDSKNGDDRRVPLANRAVGVLQHLRDSGLPGPFHGLEYNRDIRRPWNTVRAAMGRQDDEQFVIHGLRHTFCSRLVQKGVPIQVIRELAGHRNIQTTLRYAHLSPSNHRDAIDLMSQGSVGFQL